MKSSQMTLASSIFIVLICIIFGGNGAAIKFGLTGMGAFTSAGIRFAAASLVIVVWAKIRGIDLLPSRGQALLSLPHCILFTVQLACFHLGMGRTTASHGALISNVLPFVVMILAHFFIPGDRITLKKSLGVILGFIGVVFLFMDEPDLNTDLKQGDLIILGAVMTWSCSAVYVKRVIAKFHPTQLTLYPMVFCVPFYGLAALIWENPMSARMDAVVGWALFYQAFLSAAFAMVAWNAMLNRYGATALHSFVFIIPLAGVMSGVLLLDEPVTGHLMASIACIVIGILAVNMPWPKKRVGRVGPNVSGNGLA